MTKEGITLRPPIPEHRKAVYEYYSLTFDDTGCPMKQTENGMVFHPILVPYLIADYTALFEKTGDYTYLQYAENIAKHALKHAEHMGESLVFMYHPDTGLSNVPISFYSALTQAWYIKGFCTLEKHFPGKYETLIRKVFSSLLIPVSESGVLLIKEYGWVVEEYPHEPAFYTLNGWLTVLRWIVQHHKMLDKIGIQYEEFLERNLDAVEHLLPLYDAKFCLNSRYQLTGFTRIKIVFDKPVNHECLVFEIEIPDEGCFKGSLLKEDSRWKNYLERNESKLLQFNVLLSLISKPVPNIFRTTIRVNEACSVKLLLAQGEYRPDVSGMPTESWKQIGTFSLQGNADNHIESTIPLDGDDLFAYPTNFKKKIGGILYNGYHFIHIVDLADLYAFSKRPSLKRWTKQWLEYSEAWENLPILEGYSLVPYVYGEGFSKNVDRLLNKRSER